MTDFKDDDDKAHLDGIIRAVFHEQLSRTPPATFGGEELERKGLVALSENPILCVLVKATDRETIVFRGTLAEGIAWVAAQPDAAPTTDATMPLRAEADSMLSAIAADAAADARKRD